MPDKIHPERFAVKAEHMAKARQLQIMMFERDKEFAQELSLMGLSFHQATSLLAMLQVENAWKFACAGAISGGHTPNNDRFRKIVEDVLNPQQALIDPKKNLKSHLESH